MAIQQPLAEPLFTAIDATSVAFYQAASGLIAGSVQGPFRTFVVIYLLVLGFAHWRGLIQEPIGDAAMRILKIGLIGVIVFKGTVYASALSTWIYQTPQQLLDVIAPAVTSRIPGTATPGNAMDAILKTTGDAYDIFLVASMSQPWSAFGTVLYLNLSAMVLWLSVLFAMVVALAVMLLAKLLLSILLALGPIFVAFLLFETTRPMFSAWLGQCLTQIFTFVIAGIAVLVMTFVAMANLDAAMAMTQNGSMPSLSQFAGFLFTAILIPIIAVQAAAIGAALGNGVQVGTMGLVGRGIGGAYNMFRGGHLPRPHARLPQRSNRISRI
ncbi:MAG: type IV secretion system protein [Paracoccaceae bacterium]